MISYTVVKLGEELTLPTEPTGKLFTGTVVYIHPKNRFFTLEFEMETGEKFRESYLFRDDRIARLGIVSPGRKLNI